MLRHVLANQSAIPVVKEAQGCWAPTAGSGSRRNARRCVLPMVFRPIRGGFMQRESAHGPTLATDGPPTGPSPTRRERCAAHSRSECFAMPLARLSHINSRKMRVDDPGRGLQRPHQRVADERLATQQGWGRVDDVQPVMKQYVRLKEPEPLPGTSSLTRAYRFLATGLSL